MGESFFFRFWVFHEVEFLRSRVPRAEGRVYLLLDLSQFSFFSFFLENVSSGVPAGAAPFLACVFFI